MLTIDEAQSAIQDAFAPLVCRIKRGRYNESLSVRVCDADGDIVEDLGKLTQSLFGQEDSLQSILLSTRQKLADKGFSLDSWPTS